MAKETVFLSSVPGRVVALPGPVVTASLSLENFGNFSSMRAIITQIAVSNELSAKFQNMLGGNMYIYVFGERPGGLMIRGIAMETSCEDEDSDFAGVKKLQDYYNANSAFARSQPLKLTLGLSLTIVCYLVGVQISVADPKLRLWEYSLRFVTVPESAIAAARQRQAVISVAAEPPVVEEPIATDGPVLPPVTPNNPDPGGNPQDDPAVSLEPTAGYSPAGTGPNLDLVQDQS